MIDTGPDTPHDRVLGLPARIQTCRICRDRPDSRVLPHEPRPIFRFSPTARIVIASQAPGVRAHASGIPFEDSSGERLRAWMGLERESFYNPDLVAIVPMGFCFPGHDGSGGDLPPRPECRRTWHDEVFAALPQAALILCIGLYAARYHLARLGIPTPETLKMADLVAGWRGVLGAREAPRIFPLPHPSWRNTGWLNRNPWFASDVLPALRQEIDRLR